MSAEYMTDLRLAEPNSRSSYYSRFPDDEYERRWTDLRELMVREGYDSVIIHGNTGFQSVNMEYLTNYDPPFTTYLVAFANPELAPIMFVGVSNHLQYVREISIIDDLRLMLPDPGEKLANSLQEKGIEEGRVGLVGFDPRYGLGMPYTHYRALGRRLSVDLVEATAPFIHLTSTKSGRELQRVRKAATYLDLGMEALAEAVQPGVSEHELHTALAKAVSHDDGGLNNAFISSAPMIGAEPGEPLAWKSEPSMRKLSSGDIITTETSASWGGYSSQIHRPYTVDAEPTAAYQEMFDLTRDVVAAMIDALRPGNTSYDVYSALNPIEQSRYKLYDVGLHGYGNGYLHPFIGTENTNYWPGADDPVTADWTFEQGMVMVVQPNVTTPDERQSLQLGTTVIVDNPPENLQDYPLEFIRT